MDRFQQVLKTIRKNLGGITPSQKLLIGSLAVIMLMTLFLVSQYAAKPTYVAFARMLRKRRHKLGLSRHKLAQMAGISESALRNLETARVTPLRRTLESLRKVKALGLTYQDLPPWREFGCSLRVGGLLVPKPKKPDHGPASGEVKHG